MKKYWIGLIYFVSLFIIGTSPTLAQQFVESPIVRLIYFVPRDLQPQSNISTDMDMMLKQVQQHYAAEMERHGYGKKAFKIETDVNGNAVVHRMVGKFDAADYPKSGDALFDQLSEEIGQRYDLSKDIYLVAANTLEDFVARGDFEGWSGAGGIALIGSRHFGAGFDFHTAAHQLGHAFGLSHDFSNDDYLMSYGGGLALSGCDAEWLDVHRAFNHSRSAANTRTTFEMLVQSLAAPPYEMRLRFKATDPEGLHQVQLLTDTLAGPAAGSWELLKCKQVDGDSVVVEFVTTGLAPASKVFLSAIDVNGNFGVSEALPLDITQLLPPAREVSIPDANLAAVIRAEIGDSITTHTLLNLTYLEAANREIKALEGLEHAHNLKYLDLGSNGIADISALANLTHLTGLGLDNNDITDISSLANLTQLTGLVLDSNDISDISPLANLTQLTGLDLEDNNITDISPLANLTQLEYLDLEDNGISDISPLATLTHLTELYLRSNGISDISPLETLMHLTGLVLDSNGISDISPLANLTQLTGLGLDNNDITDISPLETLMHLTGLVLDSNGISDISPLANLTQLTGLGLDNNDITDISPLATLTHLTELYLRSNGISDISPLANLTQLKNLGLRDNGITDISALTNLTQLEYLQLVNNTISDISALTNLTHLTELYLRSNGISDISALTNLTHLTELGLGSNGITDVSAFTNLTHLTGLGLRDNGISDISALASLTQLKTLGLGNNDITDISPLASLTQLEYLDLGSNGIADISDLTNLTQLKALSLENNGITDVSSLANLTHLEYLQLEDNNITDISPLLGLDLSGRSWDDTGLDVRGNPLNQASLQTHIPALQARGIKIEFDTPDQAAPDQLPKETRLLANYPNPFNSETWIPYQLAEPAEVTLRIYTPEEELIRTIALGHQSPGLYQRKSRAAYWDGKNELGEPVPSGRYFYTLTVGYFTTTRKILIRE